MQHTINLHEFIKHGSCETVRWVDQLILNNFYTRKVSTELEISVTNPLLKNGKKDNLENYRGITLLNLVSKLLIQVLVKKTRASLNISEGQQRFNKQTNQNLSIYVLLVW